LSSKSSRYVYVPSAVSSFFEVCDRDESGAKITDVQRIGSRGGGFKLKRGTITRAHQSDGHSDVVLINGEVVDAKTTKRVLANLRGEYGFGVVRVEHRVELPTGSGFGTSGAGALATAIAVSDLFGLNLTLSEAAAQAHRAEVESVTGLGTVTALAYGGGAVGLVTQPGAFNVGRVDSVLVDHDSYVVVCAWFGPIDKSTVLLSDDKLVAINAAGRDAMRRILEEPTVESLLRHSLVFDERSGLGQPHLLGLARRAVQGGAVGAAQNMIGNAVHCVVERERLVGFLEWFRGQVGGGRILVSDLTDSGPRLMSSPPSVE
jgi:pantoate kinase